MFRSRIVLSETRRKEEEERMGRRLRSSMEMRRRRRNAFYFKKKRMETVMDPYNTTWHSSNGPTRERGKLYGRRHGGGTIYGR